MWHKIKNIKKNWELYIQQETPKRNNKNKNIQLSDKQREENAQAREQLNDKKKHLGNHFYRACKSKAGM